MSKKTFLAYCRQCQKKYEIKIRKSDVIAWQNGEHIQTVMPYLTANERELLISGTCGSCFSKIFDFNKE